MLHANTLNSPKNARKKTGTNKTRRMPEAFAAHLRHVGQMYPVEKHARVVSVIDAALAENPHLEFDRLPSDSSQLNPVERFGKVLRRRTTHSRLFDTLADLKASVRNSLRYFQTVRQKVKSIVAGRPKRGERHLCRWISGGVGGPVGVPLAEFAA